MSTKKPVMGRGLEALLGQMSNRPAAPPAAAAPPPRRRLPPSWRVTSSPISRSICCSVASTSRASTCARNRSKSWRDLDQVAGRHPADRRARRRWRRARRFAAIRNHRRRTPLARRADRRPRHGARRHPQGARRSRHRDGAHREHPAREPESARRGARARTPHQRIRHHAPAGRGRRRPLARGGVATCCACSNWRPRSPHSSSAANSRWAMRVHCSV